MPKLKIAFALLLTAVLIAVNAVLLAWVWLAQENTPDNRDTWTLTKSLYWGLPGVHACMNGPQMYAGGTLNLNAWHGHHEVLYHEPVRPAKVSFRFKTDDLGYVTFIGYDQAGLFDAFRFSGWENRRSAMLSGHRTGRFTDRTVGKPAIFYPFQWHEVEMHFGRGAMTVYVDGEGITQLPTRLVDLAQIGFRAGLGEAQVDDVVIETTDGTLITENFENTARFNSKIVALLSAQAAVLLLILLLLRTKKTDWESASGALFVTASILLLLTVILYHWHSLIHVQQYPPSHGKAFAPNPVVALASATARASIFQDTHTTDKPHDETRVLFLGDPQIHNEVGHEEDDFISYTGKYLKILLPDTKTLVMNGGCRGAYTAQNVELYRNTFRPYQPDIIVLSIGILDEGREDLKPTLETLLEMNKEDGIETVFMLQAVSPEALHPRPGTHNTAREIAQKHGIPVVDAYENIMRHQDNGYLFWDHTHPTAFGHDTISQLLLPILQIKINARRQAGD